MKRIVILDDEKTQRDSFLKQVQSVGLPANEYEIALLEPDLLNAASKA